MPPPDIDDFRTGRSELAAGDRVLTEAIQKLGDLGRLEREAVRTGASAETIDGLRADIEENRQAAETLAGERRRARADLGALAGQVFFDPDRMIGGLAADHPVVLLPVRIETRFESGSELKIRVYPDQIHLASHDQAITASEADAAMAFWTDRAAEVPDAAGAAWTAMAARFGPERAKYLADRFEPANLAALAPGVAPAFPAVDVVTATARPRPVARLLPSRWLVAITGADGLPLHRGWFDNPVMPDLPVSPLGDLMELPAADGGDAGPAAAPGEDLPGLSPDDPARWLTDYDKAVAAGMATTVRLPAGKSFDAGIDRLVVVGIDLSRTPEEAASLFCDHLRDHGYTDGFGLIAPGTASNNTAAQPSGHGGRARQRAERTVPRGDAAATGSDLAGLFGALGLSEPPAGFAGFPDTGLGYGTTVAALHTALWGASFGFYFSQFISPLASEPAIGAIRELLRDNLRPAGPLPALRIGSQPYGLLPLLPPHPAGMQPGLPDGGFDSAFPEMLGRMRTFVEFASVRGSNNEAAPVRPLDDIPNLVRQPPGTTSSEVIARILKLGPLATRLTVRPALERAPLQNAKDPQADARENHAKIVRLVLANLGFSPISLSLQGTSPPIFDLLLQSAPRYRIGLPWVGADLDAADTMPTVVDTVSARLDAAMSAPRSLLAIGKDDAASLLEGLLQLSAAYEYWTAGERYVRSLAVADASALRVPAMVGLVQASPALPAGAQTAVESPRQLLELKGAVTGGRSLLAHVNATLRLANPPKAMRDARAFRDALAALRDRPAREVDHALRGLLDAGSHRLDSWVTAAASRRLAALRTARPAGSYLGGYGIVHDLALETTPDSEGYVHLPSTDHAITASILRAGHMANRDDDPGAFAVRLTSSRAQNALAISEAMARGQPPSALLGYRFERGLIDDKRLAEYILPFREVAPHSMDAGRPDPTFPAEGIPAHDVVDGLALARMWLKDPAVPLARLEKVLGRLLSGTDRTALEGHLARLADILDAFGDLWVTEAVHQLVRGNTARSAAAMAVVDRQEKPAEAQVALTPRAGRAFVQRVLWIAEPDAARGWPQDFAGRTGAAANAIAASMLGAPARFSVEVQAANPDGTARTDTAPVAIELGDLGLSPLSLVMMSAPGTASGTGTDDRTSRLEQRLAAAAYRTGALPDGPVTLMEAPPAGAPAGVLGLGKLLGLLDAVRRALAGRRGLVLRDFALPDGVHEAAEDLSAMAAAVRTAAEEALQQLDTGIGAGDGAGGPADRGALLEGLEQARAMGLSLPMWFLAGADAAGEEMLAAGRAIRGRLTAALAARPEEDDDPVERDRRLIRLVLGDDFPTIAEVELPAELAAAWEASIADREALGGGAGPRTIRRWRRQMAMVRPPMRALAEALDAAALTGHTEAGAIAGLAQFPQLPGTRWVGLPFETVDGTMRRPDVSLSAVVFGEFDPSRRFAGILVDEWTEVVPERQTATSVAFQYDAPNARPPQAILLAVTPPQTPAWSADTLVSIVNESLDLARLRLLTPGQIPGAGAVLPTAFVPTNLSDEVPSWHFFERFTATAGDHLILGRS